MGLGAGNTDRLQAVFFVDRIGDPTAFGGPPVDGLIGEFDAFGLANGAHWQGRRRAGDISANGPRGWRSPQGRDGDSRVGPPSSGQGGGQGGGEGNGGSGGG